MYLSTLGLRVIQKKKTSAEGTSDEMESPDCCEKTGERGLPLEAGSPAVARLSTCSERESRGSEPVQRERAFIDDLLVRIHLIVEMILVGRPCAMGV